jgi:cis-L-3-hydroxyproline dehydratase
MDHVRLHARHLGRHRLGPARVSGTTRRLTDGEAEGPVVHADVGLSFWGGVDPRSGRVIDRRHPLHGRSLAGAVVAIPSGRGSCTASAVLLELVKAGHAPAALIFAEEEQILTFGAIAAEELCGVRLPVIELARDRFDALGRWRHARIGADRIEGEGATIPLPPGPNDRGPALSDRDQAMLDGREGEARRIAMRCILRLARAFGADALIEVTRAHLDCCIHTGPASVEIPERLAATLNAISTDLAHWRALGFDAGLSGDSERQAAAYLAMGARPSFTCAPYLVDPPRAGEQIAWAESNAVAYANSVLGARTQKYPDYLDLCIALTGRAPLAGCHRPEGRRARRIVAVEPPEAVDDAFWPLLGYRIGLASPHEIPAITGLERTQPSPDDLKAFAAAFATTSAAPMFHLVGVTPEAPDLAAALGGGAAETIAVDRKDLVGAWRTLNPSGPQAVGLVAIGNPHASPEELSRLAALADGRTKAASVDVVVTTSRASLAAIEASGVRARLAAFGVRFVVDACWCMLERPIAPPPRGAIMTNSGKYAHYGPSLVGGAFSFGSLQDCVEAACGGKAEAAVPGWLADN